jgi:ATP-dependent RNA helicase DOB1
MDGTVEGIQQAAATREALKRKRADRGEEQEEEQGGAEPQHQEQQRQGGATPAPAAAGLKDRPPPTCTHEVAVPEDYDAEAAGLDPKVYGGCR